MATRSVSRAGRAQSRPTTKKRSKARKPKLIEIDGHQLTPELYRQYLRARDSRYRNCGETQARIEEMALGDVLRPFRLTHTAKDQLLALYNQISTVGLAVATLANYPFFDSSVPHVRLCGCDALNRLAAEARHLGAKVAAIGDAIRYEEREKLQDWQLRRAAYDVASPYGIAPTVQP